MKVSVITPTWQRHDLLLSRCIPSVVAQTVPVEHVVVSDGPDPQLAALLAHSHVVYTEVPEHNTEGVNVGGWARNWGLDASTGDLIAYLDDDNAYRPKHVETLMKALTESGADFAYTQMFRHGIGDVIGTATPVYGGIDTSLLMHHRRVPALFGRWPAPSAYHIDWELVAKWLGAGAKWVHVSEVTVDYFQHGAAS